MSSGISRGITGTDDTLLPKSLQIGESNFMKKIFHDQMSTIL
jgi:hypothetical protein